MHHKILRISGHASIHSAMNTPEKDPLAVLHLDNRLYIKSSIDFFCSALSIYQKAESMSYQKWCYQYKRIELTTKIGQCTDFFWYLVSKTCLRDFFVKSKNALLSREKWKSSRLKKQVRFKSSNAVKFDPKNIVVKSNNKNGVQWILFKVCERVHVHAQIHI